ncbi:tyrosine-protein phosphatase [Eikenella sp. Marseille-P7795]|uniref:tyrosine-protein phosphatase n=1 Tax=Eikenella sp. Marseille-P7795 TaxID=2866577 RepID=UPI001CE42E51|nr:tyrosine-protein phosphatase [Eikenella sp. Marseille-P7795]
MNKSWISSLIVLLALAACAQAPAQAQTQTQAPAASTGQAAWAEPVHKEANLYRVDSKLYRSEQPVAEDAEKLQSLGIKSVVNLRYFNRSADRKVLADQGIELFNRPLLTWRISPRQVAETLYLIEQRQAAGPVLVHCYHGADRTGLIAGMYRIIYQGWSVEHAKNEMRHGPYGFHSIWRNIEDLFTEEKVGEVRAHLQQLRAQGR